MKKNIVCYGIGLILVFFSTPLGYFSVNKLAEIKGNLASEYIPLLVGFIVSYSVMGILVFSIGLVDKINEKK